MKPPAWLKAILPDFVIALWRECAPRDLEVGDYVRLVGEPKVGWIEMLAGDASPYHHAVRCPDGTSAGWPVAKVQRMIPITRPFWTNPDRRFSRWFPLSLTVTNLQGVIVYTAVFIGIAWSQKVKYETAAMTQKLDIEAARNGACMGQLQSRIEALNVCQAEVERVSLLWGDIVEHDETCCDQLKLKEATRPVARPTP